MNTRALAALAVLSLSALAGCTATGATPANYAALHGNGAVMSDTSPNPNAIPSARPDAVQADGAMGRDYDPASHEFVGGWWKDH